MSFNVDKQGDVFREKWVYLEDTWVQESSGTKREGWKKLFFF